jgi:two-component system OmpR family sensor kinase
MNNRKWLWILLPAGLGLAGVMLLIRVSFIDTTLLFPEDFDVLIILFGLSLTIFAAITLILKEVMDRLRQQSIERARKETYAEHHRFLQRLDHELKNPLTALRAGMSSLALTLSDESQHQLVQTMEAEVLRLTRLVTDLRKLAELESISLDARAINVRDFFAEVVELEYEHIHSGSRQFILKMQPETLQMSRFIGDQDLLLLAMHNLLDNAFKYTRPGDQVGLYVVVEQGDLVIRVWDTGVGIPHSEAPHVWEELYRGTNTVDIPGSGIGLALVKAIVEHHYGTTHLQSQLNEGTTVTLRLPLA